MLNSHTPFEYTPHPFSGEEHRFLSAVGWANMPADELVERAAALEKGRPPEIERVTFLTRELLARRLFDERRRAYAFAQSYVSLVDAGIDFRLLVWDWE